MTITAVGDILLNSKTYLIKPRTYNVSEAPASYPRTGGASAPDFKRPDNWAYFGSTDWIGQGQDDWIADGPFQDSWGIDISKVDGQITAANSFSLRVNETANTGGYVVLTIGTTRVCFYGKTDGKCYTPATSTSVQKSLGDASYLSATNNPRSAGLLKGTYYVSTAVGKLWSTTDGLAFTDKSTGGPSTDAYILASYKGNLWVGYANAVYTYDGTTWTQKFSGSIDGTPIIGAVGANALYFMTQGPNARLYVTDGTQLYQAATIESDFLPKRAVFLETLLVFGHSNQGSNPTGDVWRLEKTGLVPIYRFGVNGASGDYGIRDAFVNDQKVYWGMNRSPLSGTIFGMGVYDPALDLFQDAQCGFYGGGIIAADIGAGHGVHGLAQFADVFYFGAEAKGIYWSGTPGTFSLTSSLYDGNTKNINKLWGFAELNHTALTSGQSVTVSTLKDGVTVDAWGTSNTVGATSAIVNASANYKSPYLQYKITGNANGAALAVLQIALSYIEVPDNPKRQWDMILELQGGSDGLQEMRDGTLNTRTAIQMLAELNSLWNTKTTFDDLDGTQYTVILKAPRARADDLIKDVENGAITDSVIWYAIHLTQL